MAAVTRFEARLVGHTENKLLVHRRGGERERERATVQYRNAHTHTHTRVLNISLSPGTLIMAPRQPDRRYICVCFAFLGTAGRLWGSPAYRTGPRGPPGTEEPLDTTLPQHQWNISPFLFPDGNRQQGPNLKTPPPPPPTPPPPPC